MWSSLWPGQETPIGHVTNGVHIGTWLDPALGELLRYAGVLPVAPPDEANGVRCATRPPEPSGVSTPRRKRGGRASGHRPREADDRLRPPLRDLQARRAPLLRHRAPARVADPDRGRGQGSPRRRARQGRDAVHRRARAGPAAQGRVVFLENYDMGVAPRDGARLRRLAEHAASAARGVGHERHEGRDQRGAEPLGARRLVGGGLLARGRLGDRGPRPTRPIASSSTGCWKRRWCRPSPTIVRAGSR